MQDYRSALYLLLLGAAWGGSFLFLRIAAPVLGPFVVTDIRVILGALLLVSYAMMSGKKLWPQCSWRQLVILGAINCAIPFTLIAFTEVYLSASLGSILNATTPLYGALLALVFLKERYHWTQYLGFILGITGVIVLVGWSPMQLSAQVVLAIAAILVATLFYAIGGFYAARTFPGIEPLNLAFCQQFFAGLLLLPFAIYMQPEHFPPTEVVWAMLGLGILSTGVAWLLYFNLIKNVGASKTLTVTYLIPVFGMLWGCLFLDERITWGTIVGLLIVLSGIFLVYNKKKPNDIKMSNTTQLVE